MSAKDRGRWDTFYNERTEQPLAEPDPLVLNYTPPLLPNETRRALDAAGGLGHNALWLAEQGYNVDLMDISRVALVRAQEEMRQRGVRAINLFQVDFDEAELTHETYDLIVIMRFLSQPLMSQLRAAVVPGGRILFETFNRGLLKFKPNFNPAYLLQRDEALGYFSDWRILHHAELSTTSQVVAVKPE
jgi:2-polyprenyl-3-methyl-5-hydroxy-6-metoxy-1,4-benzoquinol methylase